MGWRNQIPLFLDMGYQIVCPDMMGYGGTDAPRVPPSSISLYTFKRAADDMVELARQLGITKVILGGHDWGGAIVYRIALWHPELVTHLFSVCAPYWPPTRDFVSMETLVQSGRLPNFAYQLQLASGTVEENIVSRDEIRQLLNGMYLATSPDHARAFDVKDGLHFDALPCMHHTKLMDGATLDYYADQYAKNGMHGTLNWYRTREQNYHDELQLPRKTIDIPVLFIQANKDAAIPPSMSQGMERYIHNLTKRSVDTHHWALWEAPDQVNGILKEWLERFQRGAKSVL